MRRFAPSPSPLYLNRSLSLSNGLVLFYPCLERFGFVLSDVAGAAPFTANVGNPPGWRSTPVGWGMQFGAANVGGRFTAPTYLQIAKSLSLVWYGVAIGNAIGTS